MLVVVEAIADDEVIGDFHGGIFDVQGDLQLSGLDEERTDMDGFGVMGAELVKHHLHRIARVDDILDDDDGTARDIIVQTDHGFDLSGRTGTLIGGELDEGNLTGDGEIAHQVGSEDKGAVENGQQQGISPGKIRIDLVGYYFYTFQNL